jgi:hypothetical protein
MEWQSCLDLCDMVFYSSSFILVCWFQGTFIHTHKHERNRLADAFYIFGFAVFGLTVKILCSEMLRRGTMSPNPFNYHEGDIPR